MTRQSDDHRALVRAVSKALYEVDPVGMGSSVFAPEDEYDAAAATLVAAVSRAGGGPAAVADAVRTMYPAADPRLEPAVAAAMGGSAGVPPVDAHTRRRAAGLMGFINGLLVATASTQYAREVAGIGGLLADAELGDTEALQRAGGALARMREQMRTSRDEFHLLHADKATQNHLNDRFEAALDELSLLLRAHVAGD